MNLFQKQLIINGHTLAEIHNVHAAGPPKDEPLHDGATLIGLLSLAPPPIRVSILEFEALRSERLAERNGVDDLMNEYTCKHCEGTGYEFPNCDTCEGNGWVDDPDDSGTMTCPECNAESCSECDGTGEISDD